MTGDTARTEDDHEGGARVRVAVSIVGWFVIAGSVACAALILTARWTTIGELASHFRWHLGLGAAAAALPFACLRRWRYVGALVVVAAWGAGPEGALWFGSPGLAARPATLDVVSANVLRVNERYDEALAAVLELDADVVGLLEISPEWRDHALAALSERYPYRAEGLDTDDWRATTWGMLLFSKTPLTNIVAEPLMNGGRRLRPILRADVEVAGERVTLQLAHAQRPGSAWRLSDRRVHFAALSRELDARHRIILGDLNTTSTSPLFADLCESAAVRDSRAGFGRLSSWHFQKTFHVPFRVKLPEVLRPSVAIDHALVSDRLAVLHRSTFEIPGSDHDGVRIRVALRGQDPD